MGRRKISEEERVNAVPEGLRLKLLIMSAVARQARAESDRAHAEFAQAVAQATNDGVGFRDVATLLEVPHQTLHSLVRPYKTA